MAWGLIHSMAGEFIHGWGIQSVAGILPLLCSPPCPAGRDATRAFASGDFSPAGLVDSVSGLSPSELLSIHSWLSFYSDNYEPVGRSGAGWAHTGVGVQVSVVCFPPREGLIVFPPGCCPPWIVSAECRAWSSLKSLRRM